MVGYQVADANSYITITGYGIDDVRIVKKSFVWPFQKASRISISPFDFSITLQAMTREKLSFCLPAVFTIGPNNEPESLRKYALLLTGNEDGTPAASKSHKATGRNHVQEIVKGIIEGETRVIVSTMSMEEIFRERDVFKSKIIESVQVELNQFGLKMWVSTRAVPNFPIDLGVDTTPTSKNYKTPRGASTSNSSPAKRTRAPQIRPR